MIRIGFRLTLDSRPNRQDHLRCRTARFILNDIQVYAGVRELGCSSPCLVSRGALHHNLMSLY